MNNKGFTLVEISATVLVIALVVAAVIGGSELAKQANLRAVIKEMRDYQVSFNAFKERYGQEPGDFSQAQFYFANTVDGSLSAASANGNGDGLVLSTANESNLAWRHMYLAELLTINVPIITSSNFNLGRTGNPNPQSAFKDSGYSIVSPIPTLANRIMTNVESPWPVTDRINVIALGRSSNDASGDSSSALSLGALTPPEAFALDKKFDDGIENATAFSGARTGRIRITNGSNLWDSLAYTTAGQCLRAANEYRVSNADSVNVRGCILMFELR